MKKIFLFLFFPFWWLGSSLAVFAQATITPISVNYDTQEVTFRVAWTTTHNNHVWVWVDLCPVAGLTTSTFQQAVISAASATAGSIATVSGNQRGFYVTTNPSTVTAKLSNASGKFNWCAYGSNYPPNATSYNAGTYTLKGTPPFVITGNGTIQNGNKYVGTVINSLTDATGYPGGVGRDQPHNGGTCAPGLTVVGNYCRDLTADAAIKAVCSGQEVEAKNSYQSTYATNISTLNCPSGWRPTTKSELECLYMNYRSQCGMENEVWLHFLHNYTNRAWDTVNGRHCVTCDSNVAHYHLSGYNIGIAECWYGATYGQIVPMCNFIINDTTHGVTTLCVR